jgi:predicted nucleotidyltransferase
MTNFKELLQQLVAADIWFVLIGGLAAVAHGSSYVTNDLDIAYQRKPANIKKLVILLKKLHASVRDAPTDLPFILDDKTFAMSMNFTFQTDLGALDLIGDVPGLGTYDDVVKVSEPIDLYGFRIDVLSLNGLIQAKKSAGRPKDLALLKELEAIRVMKP